MRLGLELEALVRECLAVGCALEVRGGHVHFHGALSADLAARVRRREREIVAAATGPARGCLRCFRCPSITICHGRCRYDNQ